MDKQTSSSRTSEWSGALSNHNNLSQQLSGVSLPDFQVIPPRVLNVITRHCILLYYDIDIPPHSQPSLSLIQDKTQSGFLARLTHLLSPLTWLVKLDNFGQIFSGKNTLPPQAFQMQTFTRTFQHYDAIN